MAADILHYTPCCHSDNFTLLEHEDILCNECNRVFDAGDLLEETVGYGDEV